MLRPWILRPMLLTLCCAALLWARLGGTHLHLHVCERGCDAEASVHLSGPGHAEAHHEPHHEPSGHSAHRVNPAAHSHADQAVDPQGSVHADIDVPLFDDLLAKTLPPSELPAIGLALLAVLALGLLLLGNAKLPRAARGPPVLASAPPLLRPFLRGPPAHAS